MLFVMRGSSFGMGRRPVAHLGRDRATAPAAAAVRPTTTRLLSACSGASASALRPLALEEVLLLERTTTRVLVRGRVGARAVEALLVVAVILVDEAIIFADSMQKS
jgi:hypothetical protein